MTLATPPTTPAGVTVVAGSTYTPGQRISLNAPTFMEVRAISQWAKRLFLAHVVDAQSQYNTPHYDQAYNRHQKDAQKDLSDVAIRILRTLTVKLIG